MKSAIENKYGRVWWLSSRVLDLRLTVLCLRQSRHLILCLVLVQPRNRLKRTAKIHLILYVPVNFFFQSCPDRSSSVEPVLSRD